MGADIVGALWVVLGLQDDASAQLEAANAKMEKSTSTSVGKMSGSLTGWRDQVNKSNSEMAKWATAIGSYVAPAAAAVAIAVAEVHKFGNIADEINDLAYSTGLSARKIQELQYAAALSNTEFSAVTIGIHQFTLAIAEAKDESSAAAKAFAALGVVTAGRNYDEIWEDTARAIASVEDETTRAALANTLFSRGWKEMVPYIKDYVEKSKEIKGIDYLTDEQRDDLKEAGAQLDALGYKWTILEGKIVAASVGILSGVEKAGAITGVILSSAGMGLVGELDLLMTGNAAKLDEAAKRMLNPEAYTAEALAERAAQYAATQAKPPLPTNAADVASAIIEGMTATDAKAAYLSEYTIPALQKAYDALAASGTASAEEIDAAYIQLLDAKEQLIRLTEEQTESEKDLAKAAKDVEEEYQRFDDIERDFQREMSITNPRDVARVRDLIIRHQGDVEDQQLKIGEAEASKAGIAAADTPAVVAAVRGARQTPSPHYPMPFISSVATPTVSPIPAFTAPIPATVEPSGNLNLPNITYGDLIVNIDGKQLMKVGGIMAAKPGSERMNLMQRGIS
jgi:hypothetical protein